MLIRCIANITLRSGVYKQTGEETGRLLLPRFHAPNSTGKVCVPL